jgi:hypothetical protein
MTTFSASTSRLLVSSATVVAAVTFGLAGFALAQAKTIVPTKGQSADQVKIDQSECQAIANQNTPAAAPAPAPAPSGGRARGAARGAAAGAAVGQAQMNNNSHARNAPSAVQDEYRQEQAKKGAAAGMMVGGAQQRQDRRHQAGAQQQAAASQGAAHDSAFSSCMMGRGYQIQ